MSGPNKRQLSIRLAKGADRSRWQDYAVGHPNGTAYHSPAWLEAIEKAYGFRGCCFLAEMDGSLEGVFPLVFLETPLAKPRLVSLPYCDLGGPLAESGEVEKGLLQAAADFGGQQGMSRLELRTSAPLAGLSAKDAASGSKVRMVLSLGCDAKALLSGFKAKLRSQVKKPEKDGLRAEVGGRELLEPFYRIYARNMRDLGSPAHSAKWFKCLLDAYGETMRLCLVRLADGRPAAGSVLFCHGAAATVPWASSLREMNRWNPNMLLYWTMLSMAADEGFECFDFGRSTPGEGTYKFKRQWGATAEPLYWQDLGIGPEQSLSPLTSRNGAGEFRRLAERSIRKMPVPLATWLGGRVRKYISL